jgi:hypothetical protein
MKFYWLVFLLPAVAVGQPSSQPFPRMTTVATSKQAQPTLLIETPLDETPQQPPLAFVPETFDAPKQPPKAPRGLYDDIMLHPGDSFTAYTLKKGDFIYNQAVVSIPLPSWAWWGITDRLTAEIDLLPLIGGLFIEPHLPVPSFNFRYKLRDHVNGGPAFAVEAMLQREWRPFDEQLSPESTVHIVRDGTSIFARLNMSQILTPKLRVHASLGATWAHSILIENNNVDVKFGRSFSNLVSPDASLSLDWRFSPRFSLHLTGSYGTTFVYLDNIPRKTEFTYALRVAPFYQAKRFFFREMRVEGAAFFFYFQDAKEWLALPIPIFPYLYWQW